MNLTWHWPQILLVILLVATTVLDIITQKRSGRYALFGVAWEAFLMWILYCGGFFSQP